MDRSLFLLSLEILLRTGSFLTQPVHQTIKFVKRMYRTCRDSEEIFWKVLSFQQNAPNQIGTSPNGRIFGRITHGMIPINEQRLQPEMWGMKVMEDIA
jgi:hypothetical protein